MQINVATASAILRGHRRGARLRSSSPSRPPWSNRSRHVSPVFRL